MRRLGLVVAVALAACQDGSENLSTTQQYAVVLSPSSYDFGTRQVGTTSSPATLSINPALGDNYDVVTSITESCPDFAVSAPNLPAEVYRTCYYNDCPKFEMCEIQRAICQTIDYVTYDFTATHTPTIAGATSCVVTITLNNTTTRTLTLYGTGTLPPIDIDIQPASVAFGDVRRNTASTPVNVTVRNAGGQTMTVSSASISSGFAIASGPTSSYQLAAGQTMGYQLTCNPTATGNMSGNFTVVSNDPATPTVNVPLSCRGIDSNVGLTPSPTTIPTTRVGEPVMGTVAISNSGNASMQLQSVTLSGSDLTLMSAPASGSYGTGTIGNATIMFGATDKGSQTGTLTITYDGGQTRTSQITARALATSMALTPDGDVDFGPVCAGQTKQQEFTLLANEEGSFTVTQLGGVAAPFTVAAPTLPANVAGSGGNQVTFTVTAAPTEAGAQTSSLELATNIPNSAPRMINLSVEALPAGVTPSPATLDFGSTAPSTTTIGQSVHVTNCSTAPVTAMNARIEGPSASEFAIVAQPSSSTIAAAGSVSWLVVLSADSPGLKAAEFVVDHDGGTARVPLAGEGLGDNVGPNTPGSTEEVSYYTCSTGRARSLWPVLVGLALIVLRRRRAR